MKKTAEIVVIGGGVTGVSIAFHLARQGVAGVVLLERRFLAAGGTGHSVGIIRQLYPTREATAMVRRSLEVYRQFDEVVGGTSGLVACGVLIAVGPAMRPQLESSLALQRSLGLRAELLEPEDVARVDHRLRPGGAGAVLHEPDSGYADPTGVTVTYARAARGLGVSIEQGVSVTAIRQAGGRVTGVDTTSGPIDAPVVVNAAGLWSPTLAAMAGISLPIVVGRHPVFVLERGPDFGSPHPVYLDLAGGSYARPETGGLSLTGSLTDDETQHPVDPEALGSAPGLDEAAAVMERTTRAIPRLADARYRRGWAGAFDITPDWMPIIDETSVRGLYVAAGMSGHGFKLAPAVGEMMAALITGAGPPVSLAPFRLARLAAAPATRTFVSSYLG